MKNIYDPQPSPLVELEADTFERRQLRLFVKRDDLLHPDISGNKWRKLKYNLLEAGSRGAKKLVTFGGAYSNHLAAVAAAGLEFEIKTLGIVRGERTEPLNPTLQFAESCGMELVYVSRSNFRKKSGVSLLNDLKIDPAGSFLLPEGGTNCLALRGMAELVAEIRSQLGFFPDLVCTACGTGGSLAGIVAGLEGRGSALGVSALKGDFLKSDVENLLQSCGNIFADNWQIITDYHFGGYAKFKPGLIDFINRFRERYDIPLDPVYTGKLFYAVFDLAEKGFFKKDASIVLIHTGGLQGIAGFNERFPQFKIYR